MKKRFLSMLCVLTMSSVLFSGFSAYASNAYGEYSVSCSALAQASL